MKLNLYSIRDRLIDVYMVPFPAPDHGQARMGVAAKVNSGDTDGICQAPHQFELHQIAEIDMETGTATCKKEYICDCSSLIRRGVREGGPIPSPTGASPTPTDEVRNQASQTQSYPTTHNGIPERGPQTKTQ